MSMDQDNTYQFRKASMFVDISLDGHNGDGPFGQKKILSKNLSDDLRFSKISMSENKNNHSGYYNRGGSGENRSEFRSFQIGLDGKLQKTRLEPLVNKTRNRTTPDQLQALENVCKTTMRPNKEMRIKLANKLNMNQRQVQIWFQNKRAKTKKQSKSAGERDALGLQSDDQVPHVYQAVSAPQGFTSPGQYNSKEQFFRDNNSGLSTMTDTVFFANNPLHSSQPASASYLKNYCNLGSFYPRQQEEPSVYGDDQTQEQYGVPYYVDSLPETLVNNSWQHYEGQNRDYLINRSASRMNKMYCGWPKNPYQNYNSYNNKQF